MKSLETNRSNGFSLIELLIAMTVMLVALGIVSTLMARAFSVRARETQTADALASAQAAISVISRDVANSGFGLYKYDGASFTGANNGIVLADSGEQQIRVRANLDHSGGQETAPAPGALEINTAGEDVSYFFDAATKSIVRYDAVLGETSVVVNRISDIRFAYIDYTTGSASATAPSITPTDNTARVRITVQVELDRVEGQPDGRFVTLRSEVTLRNNNYMLQQY